MSEKRKRGRPRESEGVRELKKNIQRIKSNVKRRYERMIKKNPSNELAREMLQVINSISTKNIKDEYSLQVVRDKLINENTKGVSYTRKSAFIKESFKKVVEGSDFAKLIHNLPPQTVKKVMKIFGKFMEGHEFFYEFKYNIIDFITEEIYNGRDEDEILNDLVNNIDSIYEDMQERLNQIDSNNYSNLMK